MQDAVTAASAAASTAGAAPASSSSAPTPVQSRSDQLEFVDDLKEDIFSLLDAAGCGKGDLLGSILREGVLCYSRPADVEEDRWRHARASGGFGAAPAGSSSRSSLPRGAARPPPLAYFGSPPHSSQLRWPPRPRLEDVLGDGGAIPGVGEPEDSGDSDGSEPAAGRHQRGHTPGGEEKDLSDSGESDTSERRRRSSRDCVGPSDTANGDPGAATGSVPPPVQDRAPVDVDALLEFSSCFESGNLRYVVYSPQDNAYDLVLENDVHTKGHTQWFYFAVRNGRPGQTVRLRIVNMSKAKSLFKLGMRPVAWSESRAAQLAAEVVSSQKSAGQCAGPRPVAEVERLWAGASSRLWLPTGEHVHYHQTYLRHGPAASGSYTLSWEHTFGPEEGDVVFFAMAVPFTYSMLRSSLAAITHDPGAKSWCRCKRLCATLGGVKCDLLEISNWAVSKRQKRSVVVSSRVHPGESNASWLSHGLIGFLLSPGPEAQVLRDHFIWQIVPMMNPDGVVCGNYRCGLSGVDLNRQWRHPSEALHGTVHGLKRLIQRSKRRNGCCMYIDLHGHSRKCGLFSYACAQYPKDDYRRFTVRMYPKLLSMLTPEFTPENCRWRVGKGKRGTGRAVVAKDLGLAETYTIEASFFGAAPAKDARTLDADGKEVNQHKGPSKPTASVEAEQPGQVTVPFTPAKLELLGANLARALLLHQNLHPQLKQATEKRGGLVAAPWPDVQPYRCPNTPPSSGSSTPSAASDGEHSVASEEDPPSEAESNLGDLEDSGEVSPEVARTQGSHQQMPRRYSPVRPCPTLDGDDLDEPSEDEMGEDQCREGRTPPRPTPVAGSLAESYLGIDPSAVMQELQEAPLSSTEAESNGSDSAPSQDNLDHEELARISRILKVKRMHKRGSGRGSSKKKGGAEGRSGNDAKRKSTKLTAPRHKDNPGPLHRGRRHTAFASVSRGARAASPASNDHRLTITGAGVPGSASLAAARSRQDLQKIVAFGQTTYYQTGPGVDSLAPGDVGSVLGKRVGPVRLSTGVDQLHGPGACVRYDPRPRGDNWPPISRGSVARGEQQQALLFLDTPKDRFSLQRGASSGSTIEGARRRLCVRNVSGSLLQPQKRLVADLLPSTGPTENLRSAVASSPSRPSRPRSRKGPEKGSGGGARTPTQREEVASPAASPTPSVVPRTPQLMGKVEDWPQTTPREGLVGVRPQCTRLRTATSLPPSLVRDRVSQGPEASARHEMLPGARSR